MWWAIIEATQERIYWYNWRTHLWQNGEFGAQLMEAKIVQRDVINLNFAHDPLNDTEQSQGQGWLACTRAAYDSNLKDVSNGDTVNIIVLLGHDILEWKPCDSPTELEMFLLWYDWYTPPTKSLWTVLPGADSTITVRLFQQVAVRKPLYVNHPNTICFKGHILYWSWQKMITIGFIGTMHVSLLNKPIELYNSTTNFAIFSISLQIFTYAMETPDGVHIIKSMV